MITFKKYQLITSLFGVLWDCYFCNRGFDPKNLNNHFINFKRYKNNEQTSNYISNHEPS